ncbi:alpha-L-rhamnosidase [Spirosoma oryzae]|uniref:alpha-L-rhamnosidase n=1 Tax=Spirosoma oryzae TaxID=1469603 RepID=A0A2T0TIV7_9BACT|nr:family 78 glycoside hydrolase catalytic domain [Spirosoma oryzae]PRY45541.1 alpha-L-rhamnosidase [Spirosoma oryzae]
MSRFLLALVCWLWLGLFSLKAQNAISATALRCENLTNPTALETTKPRLSWQLSGADRGLLQQSYHILVASSAEKLARNEGDLWNSGVVSTDQSIWIPYGGQTLTSRASYFWKVQIVTTNGLTSDWSQPATWTMGLMQASDRTAQWIGLEQTFPWDQPTANRTRLSARYFRKETQLTKPIRQATAYICGLGLYELHLNGQRIGTQVLAPGPTEYNKRVFYNTFDVTAQLHQGTNALGITLGNGHFFRMRLNQWALPETTHYGLPRCWMQLEVTYTDGTKQTIITDTSWKVTADGPIRANNEYDGEDYDATRELTNWHQPGFNDSSWLAAESVSAPASRLESQINPPIRIMETLRPRAIRSLPNGTYVVDMGQNITGWLRIRVAGARGTRLTMRFGELVNGDGSVYQENLRSALQTDTYVLKGEGTEVWEPRFTYHGFRYVEITGLTTPPTVAQFDGCVIYDEMAHSGTFSSSNPVLNQIVTNADWGIKGNYRGMPTDCSQRDERLGWLGDRTTGAQGESFLFDNQSLYAKWLQDIEDAQTDEGSIPDVAPSYWKLYTDNATWPAAYATIAAMLYDQYGDDRPIRAHYASMKRWIQYIDRYQQDYNYWKDEYGDWAVPPESPEIIITQDPTRKTPFDVLGSTHYYRILTLLERFATITGNDADRVWFAERARLVRDAFNRNHWDTSKQQYANNTTTANLLPLAFGMVPDDRRDRVTANLLSRLTGEYNTHVSSGVVGVQWLMRTLTTVGRPDLAYQIATNTTYPSLGYMTQQGATTIWELWNGNTASAFMNSGNHVMLLGDLLIWLYENVAGIKATEPGFRRLSMSPTPVGNLNQVSASHVSPYGPIASGWIKNERGFRWTVTIPGNCRAEVAIPATSPELVWEGSRRALESPDLVFLRQESDRVVFAVGSGTYVFTNIPPANLTMQLVTEKRVVRSGDPLFMYMTVRNEGPETATNVSVGNRLSPELSVLTASGLTLTDGQLVGKIAQLDPGNQVTYSLLLRPTVPGTFVQTAQVTAADQFDPTSIPNSGTGDGEDDMAAVDFRTAQTDGTVYQSANPHQTPLPPVQSNQPLPDSTKADLSLSLATAQSVLTATMPTTLSLIVTHQGGLSVGNVSIRLTVPADITAGSQTGGTLVIPVDGIMQPGQSKIVAVPIRSNARQPFTVQAELISASVTDPDSTPDNGLTNGEDDTAQLRLRVH